MWWPASTPRSGPDSLAALNIPLETVWAGVQLGPVRARISSTLGLSERTVGDIIIATTELMVAGRGDVEFSGDRPRRGLS